MGILIGAGIMAALGLQVILISGRRRSGRPHYAVSSARIRGAGWLTLATALLLAGANAPLAAGLLMFAAVGVMGGAVVVFFRGRRTAQKRSSDEPKM